MAVLASHRRAAVRQEPGGGGVGGRLVAKLPGGARRPAAARRAARCPHRQREAGGSRAEIAGSSQSVAAAIADPKRRRFCAGGVAPRPHAAGAGKRVTQARSAGRVSCLPARGVTRWKRVTEGVGAPVFQSTWPGIQPGQTPGLASSQVRGCGVLQPLRGCSFPVFVPRRTRG